MEDDTRWIPPSCSSSQKERQERHRHWHWYRRMVGATCSTQLKKQLTHQGLSNLPINTLTPQSLAPISLPSSQASCHPIARSSSTTLRATGRFPKRTSTTSTAASSQWVCTTGSGIFARRTHICSLAGGSRFRRGRVRLNQSTYSELRSSVFTSRTYTSSSSSDPG